MPSMPPGPLTHNMSSSTPLAHLDSRPQGLPSSSTPLALAHLENRPQTSSLSQQLHSQLPMASLRPSLPIPTLNIPKIQSSFPTQNHNPQLTSHGLQSDLTSHGLQSDLTSHGLQSDLTLSRIQSDLGFQNYQLNKCPQNTTDVSTSPVQNPSQSPVQSQG